MINNKNNKIRDIKSFLAIELLVQIILFFINVKIFGSFGIVILAYLIFQITKKNKNYVYWARVQRVILAILILEFLFGLPLFYIFNQII